MTNLRNLKQSIYLPLLLFPASFLWQEIMLRAFTGRGTPADFPATFLFSCGFGLFAAAILSLLPPRLRRRTGLCLILLTAFLFAVESMVRTVFTVYMTPGNLLSGAGNVMQHYAAEALRSVPGAFARFAVLALPGLLWLRLTASGGIMHPGGGDMQPGGGDMHPGGGDMHPGGVDTYPGGIKAAPAALALALAGVLGFFGANAAVGRGSLRDLYGAQYNFDDAVGHFGLMTGLGLEAKNAIFEQEAGFTTAGAGTAGGTWGPGKAEGPEPPEGPEEGKLFSGAIARVASAASLAKAKAADEAASAPKVFAENRMDIDFTAAEAAGKKAARLTEYVKGLAPTHQNEYTGLFAGKNLILICAEAYCNAFIRPDLTPALWRLSTKGFHFTEFYQPSWGGSTTTGEVSLTLGLAGNSGDESMINVRDHNLYFTMGNMLQREGYSSIAFHNGSRTFYKRNLTHENLGYNQFIANENGMKALAGRSYPPDTEMIEATAPLYIGHGPFSVYYMTISGHAAYEKNSYYVSKYMDRVNASVGDEYAEKTKYYICYQMELENALARLLELLEEAGIADDTVIALVGDHYPYGLGRGKTWKNDRDYIEDLIKQDDALSWAQDRNGAIIWCGSLEHGDREMAREITTPAMSLDILPTLLNLFGLTWDSRLLPGRDVFSEAEPLVYWNNLSWVTTRGMYDSRHGKYYPREGYGDDPEYVERVRAEVNNRLLMNRSILDTDYYGLLFGPDELTQAGQMLYQE